MKTNLLKIAWVVNVGNCRNTLFLSDCSVGLYIIQISNKQGVIAHKIIKQ